MAGKLRRELLDARRNREYLDFILGKALQVLTSDIDCEIKNRLIEMLRTYAINNNCSLMVTPANTISPEHKLLIRDDCNGNISGVVAEYMSDEYIAAKRKKKK